MSTNYPSQEESIKRKIAYRTYLKTLTSDELTQEFDKYKVSHGNYVVLNADRERIEKSKLKKNITLQDKADKISYLIGLFIKKEKLFTIGGRRYTRKVKKTRRSRRSTRK